MFIISIDVMIFKTYAIAMCLKANKILGDLTLEKTLLDEDYNRAADMLARGNGMS